MTDICWQKKLTQKKCFPLHKRNSNEHVFLIHLKITVRTKYFTVKETFILMNQQQIFCLVPLRSQQF